MNFIEYIYEQKNTHDSHRGQGSIRCIHGTRQAILALRSLRDMLGGVKDGNVMSWMELQLFLVASILVMVNFLLLRRDIQQVSKSIQD